MPDEGDLLPIRITSAVALAMLEITRAMTTILVRTGAARPDSVHDEMRDVIGRLRREARHHDSPSSPDPAMLEKIAELLESDLPRIRKLRPGQKLLPTRREPE